MSEGFEAELANRLEDWSRVGLRRRLLSRSSHQGETVAMGHRGAVINFSSNDYLGLAKHVRLVEAASMASSITGIGAGASRLISGTHDLHVQLETALASFLGKESVILFGNGYTAAVGAISALIGKQDVAVADRLCHASLIDGVRLSGAKLKVFKHNDIDSLRTVLERLKRQRGAAKGRKILVLTESVFSMDGDCAPIDALVALRDEFGFWLMVDEAHALGLYGGRGEGRIGQDGLQGGVDITLATLGKAFGTSGGLVAGSGLLKEYLVHAARSFMFSTAPPALISASSLEALKIIQGEEGQSRRERLSHNIALFRELSRIADRVPSKTAIQPWLVGDERKAAALSKNLLDRGFWVPAVRYPTVRKGEARLRISLSSEHSDEHIRDFASALTGAQM